MSNIEYIEGNKELLDAAQPLWEKLNEHHRQHSIHFADKYAALTFVERKGRLLTKARSADFRVDLAKDPATGQLVGYCISTATRDRIGEIESVYVEPEYRGQGIGDTLMRRALAWLDRQGVAIRRVVVAAGNEQAFTFYERYDFFVRRIELEQVPDG